MDSIKDSLDAMFNMFNSRMNEFQQDLLKTGSPISSSSLVTEFTTFRSFILSALNGLQRQVEFLAKEIDRQELQRRRKMLLLHGVTEDKAENISARVTNIFAEHLDLPNFSTASIKSSHRLGRLSDNKPRPIIIKFADVAVRDKVWFTKTKLKGTGITQSEFLTKSRHSVFLEARKLFGISKCWTREGCIHAVAEDGSHHRIECLADLNSVSSSTTKSPEQLPVTSKSRNIVPATTRSKRLAEEIHRSKPPDAFVVIYSVVDKASFQRAEQELARLLDCDMLRARRALLVGNKIDLARSRAVSTKDGKCLACTYKAKFIEVSVGINLNVDKLLQLVGILNQIRLKKQRYLAEGGRESSPANWYKTRGVVRASMKARQMLTWIFGKEPTSCEWKVTVPCLCRGQLNAGRVTLSKINAILLFFYDNV